MKKKIWLSSPHQTGKEKTYLQEVLDCNWLAPNGQQVQQFEENLVDFLREENVVPSVVMTTSGTAAIHMALRALNVQKGDWVLCQTLTFVGSINPVLYQGATPVLIDSEVESWNICPQALEDAIQYCLRVGKRPKVIIVVDLYGNPAQWKAINYLANRYEIPILEDAAEALGSEYAGRKAGLWGQAGVFSFNGNKIITASSGGALVSQDPEVTKKVRFWINQSKENVPFYHHKELGYNYQMSELCGAVGRAQLEYINQRVQARRQVFESYQQALHTYVAFQQELPEAFSNRWLTSIVAPSDQLRERMEKACQQANIDCRRVWKPMHLQPLLRECHYFGSSHAANLFERGLCLPSSSHLTHEELAFIQETILGCF